MGNKFQNKWWIKLEKEREKVLSWERPFLPPVPEELTEESVILYIKQIKPQLRRANNRPWRFITWVLVDLIFWGLVVLVVSSPIVVVYVKLWFYILPLYFLSCPIGYLWKGARVIVALLLVPFLFCFTLIVGWIIRLWDKKCPSPIEILKEFDFIANVRDIIFTEEFYR